MNVLYRVRRSLMGSRFAGPCAAVLAMLASAGGVHAQSSGAPQNWLEPAGIVAELQLRVFNLSLALMILVFTVVVALLIYTLVRFRDRGPSVDVGSRLQAGVEAAATGDPGPNQRRPLPPQVEGNHTLEIIWTVIPFLLLVILAIPTVQTNYSLAAPPEGDPIDVRVVAHQWWWEFEYPEEGIVTANELRIPVGRPVRLTVETDDVIHKFWVPKLAGKLDAVPGRVNEMWLQADREGVFYGQCVELCGASHALMRFRVIAQAPEEFERWVKGWGAPPAPRSPEEAAAFARGYELFTAKGCHACHAVEGTGWAGNIGPNLTHFGSRLTVAGGIMDNTPENVARWLANPPAVKPDSRMPNLGLSPQEIADLVVFLRSL